MTIPIRHLVYWQDTVQLASAHAPYSRVYSSSMQNGCTASPWAHTHAQYSSTARHTCCGSTSQGVPGGHTPHAFVKFTCVLSSQSSCHTTKPTADDAKCVESVKQARPCQFICLLELPASHAVVERQVPLCRNAISGTCKLHCTRHCTYPKTLYVKLAHTCIYMHPHAPTRTHNAIVRALVASKCNQSVHGHL